MLDKIHTLVRLKRKKRGLDSLSGSRSETASNNGAHSVVASNNKISRVSSMIFYWFYIMFDKIHILV